MNKKLIFIGIIALSVLSSILDVIFFRENLYQGTTGAFALFFIRSFIELFLFAIGLSMGWFGNKFVYKIR